MWRNRCVLPGSCCQVMGDIPSSWIQAFLCLDSASSWVESLLVSDQKLAADASPGLRAMAACEGGAELLLCSRGPPQARPFPLLLVIFSLTGWAEPSRSRAHMHLCCTVLLSAACAASGQFCPHLGASSFMVLGHWRQVSPKHLHLWLRWCLWTAVQQPPRERETGQVCVGTRLSDTKKASTLLVCVTLLVLLHLVFLCMPSYSGLQPLILNCRASAPTFILNLGQSFGHVDRSLRGTGLTLASFMRAWQLL